MACSNSDLARPTSAASISASTSPFCTRSPTCRSTRQDGAQHAAGQVGAVGLVVDDFAIGDDGFDDRPPHDHGDVDARLFHGRDRGKLNAPLIRGATAVVLGSGRRSSARRARAKSSLSITGVVGQLCQIGMIEHALRQAVLFAPAVAGGWREQFGVALDAAILGHVMGNAPELLLRLRTAGQRGELRQLPFVEVPPQGGSRQHGDDGHGRGGAAQPRGEALASNLPLPTLQARLRSRVR